MFHLVSVCCSRCCSPRALTRGHTRAARTHPALPISVIRAALIVRRARNDDQCLNGRVLSGQSASAHAERQSGPAPNGRRTRRPCTTELGPPPWSMQPGSTQVCALCFHPFSCMQLGGPHAHALPCCWRQRVAREARGQA
jgi:hypothetical protein